MMTSELCKVTNHVGTALVLVFAFLAPWSLWGMQAVVLLGILLLLPSVVRVHISQLHLLDWAVVFYALAVLYSWVGGIGLPFDHIRMTGVWTIAAYILFRSRFGLAARQPLFIQLWAGSLCIVCVYGILQYFFGWDWVRLAEPSVIYPSPGDPQRWAVIGFFDRHNTFAASIAAGIAVVGGTFLTVPKTRLSRFIPLLLLPPFAAVILAQSRMAWAALAVGMAVPIAFGPRKRIALFGFIIGSVLVLIAFLTVPGLSERIHQIYGVSAETSRLDIWRVSFHLIADQPISGWGAGRFFQQSDWLFRLFAPYIDIRSGTHNLLLSAWFGGGFVIILAEIAILLSSLIFVSKSWINIANPIPTGAAIGLMILIIVSMGHNMLADGELSLLFWSLLGILGSFGTIAQDISNPNEIGN